MTETPCAIVLENVDAEVVVIEDEIEVTVSVEIDDPHSLGVETTAETRVVDVRSAGDPETEAGTGPVVEVDLYPS